MLSMQAHEVKTQLSEVLRKVEGGEEILISRHGKIVAQLSPCNTRKLKIRSRLEAVGAMQHFKRIRLPKGETIDELRTEGRH